MQIQCPQCQDQHDIETDISPNTWICHHCGHEFNPVPIAQCEHEQAGTWDTTALWQHTEHQFPKPPFIITTAESAHPIEVEQQADDFEMSLAGMPPQRQSVHIWPWLLVMLIAITSAGFWMQHEQWLDNRWIRSTLMNLNMPMQQRDKDWSITPESVRPEWVVRSDGSKVLLIHGKLNNLLACELLAPDVEITFYAQNQPDKVLDIQQLPISMRPDEKVIKQIPFIKPEADTMPIGPLSSREFVFVIQSLPGDAGDFTLSAKTALQN